MNGIYRNFVTYKSTNVLQVYFPQINMIYKSLFCITNP
jgi:hypothetical protein